jgi:hypothetical protein
MNEIIKAADFAALRADTTQVIEAIRENMGDASFTRADLDRVKIPAGGETTWKVEDIEGSQFRQALDAIILSARDSRAYWVATPDQSGGGKPPDCFSDDGLSGMGSPGGMCATCPLARFGSAANGRGQACKAIKMMFVLLPGDMLPRVIPASPTSLKGIRQYMARLTNKLLPYWQVVTRLKLEQRVNAANQKFAVIVPEFISKLDESSIEVVRRIREQLSPVFNIARARATDFNAEGDAYEGDGTADVEAMVNEAVAKAKAAEAEAEA